jgi:transcriptional regulator with XRE-family HTH domain
MRHRASDDTCRSRPQLSGTRVSPGVAQRELARRLGKPPSFINRNEQPERQLDVLEFVAIAKALNIEPVDLVRTAVGSLPKKSDLLRRGSFRPKCCRPGVPLNYPKADRQLTDQKDTVG